jgi:hypothetical protein
VDNVTFCALYIFRIDCVKSTVTNKLKEEVIISPIWSGGEREDDDQGYLSGMNKNR